MDSLGYAEPQGLAAARCALADYLRRTRGVQATQAIALTARALQDDDLPLAMEAPASGGTEWCCDTTESNPWQCRSTITASTSKPWPPAV